MIRNKKRVLKMSTCWIYVVEIRPTAPLEGILGDQCMRPFLLNQDWSTVLNPRWILFDKRIFITESVNPGKSKTDMVTHQSFYVGGWNSHHFPKQMKTEVVQSKTMLHILKFELEGFLDLLLYWKYKRNKYHSFLWFEALNFFFKYIRCKFGCTVRCV